jgi:signal peptidase I
MKGLGKALGLMVLSFLVVIVSLRLFVLDLVSIDAHDMLPTLGPGGSVIVNRRIDPERGDLVMFRTKEGKDIIRRVIGLPGEKVRMVGLVPVIDGKQARQEELRTYEDGGRKYRVLRESFDERAWDVIDDTYRTSPDWEEHTIEGGYFVLADHREVGSDSRQSGVVARADIRGVVWRVWDHGRLAPAATK